VIKLKLLISQWLASITRKLRNNFYLYLSAVLTVLILLDASVFHIGQNMRDRAFDLVVKNRIPMFITKADSDIIIVDINEASLSAMAGEYGRWPWPRQVFGEFVENIESQNPKAIVFDILFSDPDVYNPDSDTYFNEVVASTDNTYFPMLRLSEESDKLSQITPSMIQGLQRTPDSTSSHTSEKTVAIVLPFFDAIKHSKRLGTNNIYQDADGIVREYKLWRDESNWRIPALPLVVGNLAPTSTKILPQDMLINWRGKPFSYQYVTFSDVYKDMSSKVKTRAGNEFTNKIVIIGSTAPSLFDVKATAVAKAHPGVEILATAIDNVKHRDYLKVWRGKTPYILMSLLLVWLTALAFYRNVDRDKLIKIFGSSQLGLLALSYLVINFTNTYLDITGPITWAILYFSVAKIYALANERAMQRILASDVASGKKGAGILLMPINIEAKESLTDNMLKKLQQALQQRCQQQATVEILKGTQSGIWGLFSDIITISWAFDSNDVAQTAQVKADAEQLGLQLKSILQSLGMPKNTGVRYVHHIGHIGHIGHEESLNNPTSKVQSSQLTSQWRGLFAQAILKLDVLERDMPSNTTTEKTKL